MYCSFYQEYMSLAQPVIFDRFSDQLSRQDDFHFQSKYQHVCFRRGH